MKNFNVWKLERKMKNKGTNKQQQLDSGIHDTRPLSMCVPSFNLLSLRVPEKSVTKYFNVWKLERKENEEIKGQISISSLIPVYMIHLPTVHVCTKFQSSRPHSSWEKCDEKFLFERLRNDWITEWQNPRMTENKANPVQPPLFQSGAVKRYSPTDTSFVWKFLTKFN